MKSFLGRWHLCLQVLALMIIRMCDTYFESVLFVQEAAGMVCFSSAEAEPARAGRRGWVALHRASYAKTKCYLCLISFAGTSVFARQWMKTIHVSKLLCYMELRGKLATRWQSACRSLTKIRPTFSIRSTTVPDLTSEELLWGTLGNLKGMPFAEWLVPS